MTLGTIELSSLIIGSTALLGVLAKFLHSMRYDIRKCWCIEFRSPTNSRQVSESNNAGFSYQNNNQNIPVVPTLPIHNDNNLMRL